jgi:hypothetical protein
MAAKGSTNIRDLQEEMVDAAFGYQRVAVRRWLKETRHRNPTDSEVEKKVQDFLEDGRCIDALNRLVSEMQDLAKAQGISDGASRRFAYQFVIDGINAKSKLIDRPRGRPKTREPIKSLINGVLPESYFVHLRSEKARRAELKKSLIARTAGAKLRAYMRLEGRADLSLEEAKQYVLRTDATNDVLSIPVNAKTVRDFIEEKQLSRNLAALFEKELSRKKMAIAKVLKEALRKNGNPSASR